MIKAGSLIAVVVVAGAIAIPRSASAQQYGGLPGPRSPSMSLQSLENAGPDSMHHGKSDDDLLKEAKRKYADADPRVRVDGLEKLRYVAKPADANELLFRGLSDTDVRVRIKAIDVLGARGENDAVAGMAQDLFLRETPQVEKLHLVAALG